MIKVLVVDDHDLVRHGIKRLLEDAPGVKVIGEASSGEEAVQLSRTLFPHVVLMDVKMPGIGGLEATRKLKRINPDIKVLVVTSCEEAPFPSKLLQAGAAGFLTKGASTEEMLNAIKSVGKGERYISPEIAQRLAFDQVDDNSESPFKALSDRELQVAIMICSGKEITYVAEKFCVATKTVNSYRYRIFEKLGVNNNVELTHLAMRYGILEDADKE